MSNEAMEFARWYDAEFPDRDILHRIECGRAYHAGLSHAQSIKSGPPPIAYEYKSLRTTLTRLLPILQEQGREGWLLVSYERIYQAGPPPIVDCVLARAVAEPAKPAKEV